FFVTLNLFPYNPGHVMIVPNRHTETIEDFTPQEDLECFKLQRLCIQVLQEMYRPHGFNMGYNIGVHSGASIAHLHFHVVPRYRSELGFLDVINGTRVIVESPHITKDRMAKTFKRRAE
ncbi:HIT domain-containing protein, partial [bacterium]|nr:HIT domain-containing protein [bacterium]